LTQAAEVREDEGSPLLGRQLSDVREHGRTALGAPRPLPWAGPGIRRRLEQVVDRLRDDDRGTAVLELVEDLVTGNRHEPRGERAAGRIKLARPQPELEEDVLNDLVGVQGYFVPIL
jgi:hypothetical protein